MRAGPVVDQASNHGMASLFILDWTRNEVLRIKHWGVGYIPLFMWVGPGGRQLGLIMADERVKRKETSPTLNKATSLYLRMKVSRPKAEEHYE